MLLLLTPIDHITLLIMLNVNIEVYHPLASEEEAVSFILFTCWDFTYILKKANKFVSNALLIRRHAVTLCS